MIFSTHSWTQHTAPIAVPADPSSDWLFLLCCTVIAYKLRLQSTVSTLSTKAEFLAAVTTAKIVKYLPAVLKELDYLIDGPSLLLVDNKAAIDMINKKKPTPCLCHIEIQHYAIQEWRNAHHIIMQHIPGILNMSYNLTKALAWMLHGQHACCSMGHFLPKHAAGASLSVSSLDFSCSNVLMAESQHRDPSPSEADGRYKSKAFEAGESVRTQLGTHNSGFNHN